MCPPALPPPTVFLAAEPAENLSIGAESRKALAVQFVRLRNLHLKGASHATMDCNPDRFALFSKRCAGQRRGPMCRGKWDLSQRGGHHPARFLTRPRAPGCRTLQMMLPLIIADKPGRTLFGALIACPNNRPGRRDRHATRPVRPPGENGLSARISGRSCAQKTAINWMPGPTCLSKVEKRAEDRQAAMLGRTAGLTTMAGGRDDHQLERQRVNC